MTTAEARPPVRPGEPAPDFTLPRVDREGPVSLADYRGRKPLLLALFRGLYCPFCRRHIAQVGITRQKLLAAGVETLAIVATQPQRARLYLRFHPTSLPLAADPDVITHRAYGLPQFALTPELFNAMQAVSVNPTGELPQPMPLAEVSTALDRLDDFKPTETDHEDFQRQGIQLVGQFFVDSEGIVRWANVEGASEGLAGAGKFPSDEELLAAARAL